MKKKQGIIWGLSVLLVLLLALTAVTASCVPRSKTPATPPTPAGPTTEQHTWLANKVTAIEQRHVQDITALEVLVANLRTDVGATSGTATTGAIAQINTRLSVVEQDIAVLKQDVATLKAQVGTAASGSADPEDVVEVNILQQYTPMNVIALAPTETTTLTTLVTVTLENMSLTKVGDVTVVATIFPQLAGQAYTTTVTLNGAIMFMAISPNTFQSWGPLSLNAGAKKTYQLALNVTITNNTAATIPASTITIPVQAYVADYSS